jgi:hypothetical protein
MKVLLNEIYLKKFYYLQILKEFSNPSIEHPEII